jgi:hypothetical protein
MATHHARDSAFAANSIQQNKYLNFEFGILNIRYFAIRCSQRFILPAEGKAGTTLPNYSCAKRFLGLRRYDPCRLG